VKKPGVLLVSQ